MDIEEIAKLNGFENASEMHKLVSSADISTAENLAAFQRWQNEDGSKKGLLKLMPNSELKHAESKP